MEHEGLANLGCNGELLGSDYGSWVGHILPGALFITWGLWHLLNIFYAHTHLVHHLGHDRGFCSQASYNLHLPSWPWCWRGGGGRPPTGSSKGGAGCPVESVLKVVGAVVGMVMELWTGGSYQALLCKSGSAHPGWIRGENVNNWQHAILYPPILLSGLVDLLAPRVPLPPNTPHAFLALVFVFQSLIMSAHAKPVPLDDVVHRLLAGVQTALALVTLLEAYTALSRQVVLVAWARASLMVLQGTWLCAIARIMFEHRVAWDTHLMAPHDYAPVLLCWHVLGVAASSVALYTAFAMWQRHARPGPPPPVAYSALDAGGDHRAAPSHGQCGGCGGGGEEEVGRGAGGSSPWKRVGGSPGAAGSSSSGSSDVEMSCEVVLAGGAGGQEEDGGDVLRRAQHF